MKNLKLIFIPVLMILALFSCQKDAENLEIANHSDRFVQNRTYDCEFEKNLDKAFCIQFHKAVSSNNVFARSGYSGNAVIPEKLEAFEPAIDSGGWIVIENGEHDLHVFPYHETGEDIAFYVNDWTEGNDGWVVSKGAVTVEQPAGTPLTNELQVLPFISQSLESGSTISEIEQSILPYGSATVQEDTLSINLNDNAVFPDSGGEYLIWDPCRNFQERAVDKYLKSWGIDDETAYGSASDYNAVRQGIWDLLAEGPTSEPNGQECGNCFFNQFQIAKNLLQNYGAYLTDEQEEAVKRNFVGAMLNLNESEMNELFAFGDNNSKLTCILWNSLRAEEVCEIGYEMAGLADAIMNDGFMDVCQTNLTSDDMINESLSELSCDDPNTNDPLFGLSLSDFRDKLNDKYKYIEFRYLDECPRIKCAYEKLAEIGLCSEIFDKYEELEGEFDLIISYDYNCETHQVYSNGLNYGQDCSFSGNLSDYADTNPAANCHQGVCNPFSFILWNKHACEYGNDIQLAAIMIHELLHSELHRWLYEATPNITSYTQFMTNNPLWIDLVVKKYQDNPPPDGNHHRLIEYFRDRIIQDLMLLNGDTDTSQENLDRYYMLVYELLAAPYPSSPAPPRDDLVELGFLTPQEYAYYSAKKDELIPNNIFSDCD